MDSLREPGLHVHDATTLAEAVAAGELSAAELMAHTYERLDALNGAVNAVVSLRPRESALADAHEADAAPRRGWLHGLPFAVKDLVDTAGLRTTYGSPLFAAHVPLEDAPLVRRLRAAGAIVIGKSNTPEFGLGSQSYNPVHGTTRNPYDLARTAGGSSGGAAAALAARLLPLADGSDMMGSLRNPAAFCNVYGLRPSVGLLPGGASPGEPPDDGHGIPLATDGPMARSVRDLAGLLDTLAGTARFAAALADVADGPGGLAGRRLGWLGDLGGHCPTEPGVLALCESALGVFERLGASVEPLWPDIEPEALWQAWTTLRSARLAASLRVHFDEPRERELLKPEARWEIERGLSLSPGAIRAAVDVRERWLREVARHFARVDALALPSAQCFPFDASMPWPAEVAGRPMRTYHEWMAIVVPASLAGLPALALPAGFGDVEPLAGSPADRSVASSADASIGLPAGLQLVGPAGADAALLRLGEAYHRATDWPSRRPPP